MPDQRLVHRPVRISGGAPKARPPAAWRMVTRPAPHSWTMASAEPGLLLAASQAWQVPSVGCPANGSSWPGVKMRTR